MKRSFCIRLGLPVLLAACQSPPATALIPSRPAATIGATPTPYYVGPVPVISPDGKTRAQSICYVEGFGTFEFTMTCTTHFPKGNALPGGPIDGQNQSPNLKFWSPDNNYVVVCRAVNCPGFELWDMVDGIVKRRLPGFNGGGVWQWEPDQAHTMLVLEGSEYDGFPDFLIQYDPAQDTEATLGACPDWISSYFREACRNFPGSEIGAELSVLTGTVDVKMIVRTGAVATTRDLGTQHGNSKWEMAFGRNTSDFSITPQVLGYVATPISYTVHISGTQAFVTDHGVVSPLTADHLDFHFEVLK